MTTAHCCGPWGTVPATARRCLSSYRAKGLNAVVTATTVKDLQGLNQSYVQHQRQATSLGFTRQAVADWQRANVFDTRLPPKWNVPRESTNDRFW